MKKVFAVIIVVLSLWCVAGVRSHLRAQGSTPAAAQAQRTAAQRAAAQQTPATGAKPAAQPAARPALKPDARPTPLPATQSATQPAIQPARANGQRPAAAAGAQAQPGAAGTKRIVDFEADQMRPIKLANDSTALSLQGKVVFYHNGAVIQCDSAVRYSDKRMECFDNVVINKQKTYVYGDRADYNGDVNTARVYAPVIKIVDDDVVMHTYNFSFNTLTNTGQFWGRGTVRQKGNLLESERGYYYSDERRAVCVDRAEMRNEDYQMISDSVSYDMNTEQAEFFVLSYIWNQGGEILSAERGKYIKADSAYRFTRAAYVINKDQELWSDTLHYNSRTEDAELWHNIQIRDEGHSVVSFGDYGLYWGKREEAMLTRDPQALNFDKQQKEDTLYIRSDSMFLYTISREAAEQISKIAEQTTEEELITAPVRAKTGAAADSLAVADTAALAGGPGPATADSLAGSATQAELEQALDQGADSLSPKEQRALEKERKRAADKAERDARNAARAKAQKEKDAARAAEQKLRDEARAEKSKRKRGADDHDHDHEGHQHVDSVALRAAAVADSLSAIARADSVLAVSKARTDSLLTHGKTEKPDSMVRIMRAYRNVRMFRTDFQAVCDSLVTFSIDSTAHMYIDPVMWNGLNQIKSDVIDIYSRDQQLLKAVFTGKPIMSSQVDTTHYNQVRGKVIEAHFRDNEIYRTDVNGNGETLYYMTEKDSLGYEDVVGFLVAECANISFDIEGKQVTRITYKGNPVYSIYPMDKIPADQPQRFPDFVWEIERKPALEDVFTRTVRPSQRERYEALPLPVFPITDQITKHCEQMIKDGTWRDRNDVLGEHALLFIRSLGY